MKEPISLLPTFILQSIFEEIGDALIEHVVSKYSIPKYMIMDEDSVIMSILTNYLFTKLGIKIEIMAQYTRNHCMQNMELSL